MENKYDEAFGNFAEGVPMRCVVGSHGEPHLVRRA
jgi:hypothetical protein